jgi:hypothetical protein
VPVLAGTVIGPIQEVISKSTHPPLHIPLPLLSFESCLDIIAKKNPQKYTAEFMSKYELRQLIYDVGGHCRALEILYLALESKSNSLPSYWRDVYTIFVSDVGKRYQSLGNMPYYGYVVAKSFLSLQVGRNEKVLNTGLTFMNLEEMGVIKLVARKLGRYDVKIPLIFVECSFRDAAIDDLTRLWKLPAVGVVFGWEGWEKFNCDYLAFRIGLFAYLGKPVWFTELFSGAKMNISQDFRIEIPPPADIVAMEIQYRYPKTQEEDEFQAGCSVLNGKGAPAFDSFMYLKKVRGERILLGFQMKFSSEAAGVSPLKIQEIKDEYAKMEREMKESFEKPVEFFFILLSNREGDFDEKKLPLNCVVVSLDNLDAFYGDHYSHRIRETVSDQRTE